MNPTNLSPESLMLQQVDGQWQKLCMLAIFKLVGRDHPVTIKAADIKALHNAFPGGIPVMCIHGHVDGFTLSVIDEESAMRLRDHHDNIGGRA